MTDKAAVLATFDDVKHVKTRKCWQLIFEVPEERFDQALAILGGSPQSGETRWVGIARVDEKLAQTTTEIADDETPKPERPKGGAICKRAVMACKDEAFTRWLAERWHGIWNQILRENNGDTEHIAKHTLYWLCGIKSRAELDHNREAARRFIAMHEDFYAAQQGRTDEDIRTQRDSGPGTYVNRRAIDMD